MGGELTNVKYRDGRKNFKLFKGAEKVFYNIDNIVGFEYCVITEGEMDVLALHEAGITNAISVPNGATLNSNNLDYLDSCIDYFEDKEKVILAVDDDEAGQALQVELIRRLGSEVCYLASFEDCKDANEYLLKHGKEKLTEGSLEQDRYRSRTLLLSEISKMKSLTLLEMVLSRAFKLVYVTLTIFFLRILANLLLSLEYLLRESRISLIRWLLGIIETTAGKLLSHLQRMYRRIFTLIN